MSEHRDLPLPDLEPTDLTVRIVGCAGFQLHRMTVAPPRIPPRRTLQLEVELVAQSSFRLHPDATVVDLARGGLFPAIEGIEHPDHLRCRWQRQFVALCFRVLAVWIVMPVVLTALGWLDDTPRKTPVDGRRTRASSLRY